MFVECLHFFFLIEKTRNQNNLSKIEGRDLFLLHYQDFDLFGPLFSFPKIPIELFWIKKLTDFFKATICPCFLIPDFKKTELGKDQDFHWECRQ